MRDFTLQNVGEPTNAKDVATKGYVDNSRGGAFEVKNGGYEAKGHLYIRNQKIGGVRDPVNDGEAANKRYVDNYVEEYMNGYVENFKDENDNFVLPWKVNMAGKKLYGLSFSSKSDEAATKSYVDEAIKNLAGCDALVSKEGVFLKENGHYRATTSLDIDNNKIENLPEPKEGSDTATKKYVDDVAKTITLEEALIKENGCYNVANAYINMNFNNIKNIGESGHISDAATKGYVDSAIANKVSHIIAVNASYHGDLITGDYQFTFSGSSLKSYKKHDMFNGFLIPHGGRIKRFEVEVIGLKFRGDKYNDFDTFIKETYGFDVPIPLFSLVLIKEHNTKLEIVELGKLNVIYPSSGLAIYSFISNLPDGVDKYKLELIDILNIRTEINTTDQGEAATYTTWKRGHHLDSVEEEFFTYLVTILIELDPL